MNENIYIHSFKTAQEQGETEQYRQSAAQNRACASAIDNAISDSHYDQYHYKLSDALEAATVDFGIDRVAFVVAGLIHSHDYDGRYSSTNKAWAQDFPGTVEDARQVVINSHPTLVDGFADKVRAAQLALALENPLKTAEMGMEQNYNQLDGIINNESPRSNQGYVILESEIIGNTEIVLAENKNAPQPFVTWQRNTLNDELDGGRENFFWGHYLGSEERAREDFGSRVKEKRDDILDAHPSIRAQLKENAAHHEKQSPASAQKRDAQER